MLFADIVKKHKIKTSLLTLLIVVFGGFFFLTEKESTGPTYISPLTQEEAADLFGADGTADSNSWQVFENFTGYETKADPQKVREGANPIGQNTFINDGDRISIRDFGYEFFPSDGNNETYAGYVSSLHTFRKRNGENIIIFSTDDTTSSTLFYYDNDVGSIETLETGYTTGKTFGFADHNTNVDQSSYVYFGNAEESYSRWTGNVAVLSESVTVGTTTLRVDSTTLFPTTGNITYCGQDVAYSAKTATTFTVPTTTITCASGRGVAEQVETFASAPKGNILIVLNTRMFVAGVASSTQTLFYSKIADATDFTFSSPRSATDGGVINMPEGGGGITGLAVDEQSLYAFKRSIIKSITFTQDGEDLPVIQPLKPYDGRSQTVGATSQRCIFAGGNGIFFTTPNNEIMNISRVADYDYPQVTPISDIIKPTVNSLSFDNCAGVYWQNKAYFAVRSENSSAKNDTVLVWNTAQRAWESPVIGLNAFDFSISNLGDDEAEDLFFGSHTDPNIYKIISEPLDDTFPITANWRSREETFGRPHVTKSFDMAYVEGYITDNTTLNITWYLDEDGYTQSYTTSITGSDLSEYQYSSDSYNLFGFHPFGFQRFGSNDDFSGKKKFRIYFAKGFQRVPFHSVQIEFSSDGENQKWEILRYGYSVRVEPNGVPRNLLKSL